MLNKKLKTKVADEGKDLSEVNYNKKNNEYRHICTR